LHGDAITHLPESQRVKRGIARTFQINSLLSGLTVLENI
jgi:branched-chain amino acid transport system ATP-binding protein